MHRARYGVLLAGLMTLSAAAMAPSQIHAQGQMSSELPREIRIDLAEMAVVRALRGDDLRVVLAAIADLRRLSASRAAGDLHYHEARAAAMLGEIAVAERALGLFLNGNNRESRLWQPALEFSLELETIAQRRAEDARERTRLQTELRNTGQATVTLRAELTQEERRLNSLRSEHAQYRDENRRWEDRVRRNCTERSSRYLFERMYGRFSSVDHCTRFILGDDWRRASREVEALRAQIQTAEGNVDRMRRRLQHLETQVKGLEARIDALG